jgi:excisionase family DNA binding protein
LGTASNGIHTPQLLSVAEAAEHLSLSTWTIRQWCLTGKLASHKIGSRVLIPLDAIDELLKETLRPRQLDVPGEGETR